MIRARLVLLCAALPALFMLVSCGGAKGGALAGLTPSGPTLPAFGSVRFEAVCSFQIQDVDWSTTGGSITPQFSSGRFFGHYVAPGAPGVYFVEATIQTDNGSYFANAMVVVQ
jgi:hypothetical protein